MHLLGPFAFLMTIAGKLGCDLFSKSPWFVHKGNVYELQVAPEGSHGSQRETTEELLRGWPHLILVCWRLSHHMSEQCALKCVRVCVCAYERAWVVILKPLFASTAAPNSCPTTWKRGECFNSYFYPPACLHTSSPNQTSTSKLRLQKIPSRTACGDFQENDVS